MPRLKQIGKLRLYRPGLDTDKPWSAIAPVISAQSTPCGAKWPPPHCGSGRLRVLG